MVQLVILVPGFYVSFGEMSRVSNVGTRKLQECGYDDLVISRLVLPDGHDALAIELTGGEEVDRLVRVVSMVLPEGDWEMKVIIRVSCN